MDEIRLTLFISFEHLVSRTIHNLSVNSISHCILPDHLMILYLLLLLLLLFLLHLAYDETAVMADKNVLSSNEDTQFDDSEAPYLILPNLTLLYLTLSLSSLPLTSMRDFSPLSFSSPPTNPIRFPSPQPTSTSSISLHPTQPNSTKPVPASTPGSPPAASSWTM
jgi:hypothetical protein